MTCPVCEAPVARADGYCTDACRYDHIVRRRDELIARRGMVVSDTKRYVPRKPAWRSVVVNSDGRKPTRCLHRHRTRSAAIMCGEKMYASLAVTDVADAEMWPDE